MSGHIYKCQATFINVRPHLQMSGYIYKCQATLINVRPTHVYKVSVTVIWCHVTGHMATCIIDIVAVIYVHMLKSWQMRSMSKPCNWLVQWLLP